MAAKLNMSRTTLWKFTEGKSRLNPDMAAILGQITDKSAREWIGMQAAFDTHQAESRS